MKGKAKNSLLLLFYFCNKSELDKKNYRVLALGQETTRKLLALNKNLIFAPGLDKVVLMVFN